MMTLSLSDLSDNVTRLLGTWGVRQDALPGPVGLSGERIERFAAHRASDSLSIRSVDAWKSRGIDGHPPRVMVDDLVPLPRSWWGTVAETELADVTGERKRCLAVRGLATRPGLPSQVGVSTETKAYFIDLTRPVHDNIRCTLTRSPQRAGSDESDATLSEMLPTPDRAWLPGSCGRRYASPPRLRLVALAGAAR